jgi:hypothetical protein
MTIADEAAELLTNRAAIERLLAELPEHTQATLKSIGYGSKKPPLLRLVKAEDGD